MRATTLKGISRALAKRMDELSFEAPVAFVYNPLRYARAPHEQYLERYGSLGATTLLLGMNPGWSGPASARCWG